MIFFSVLYNPKDNALFNISNAKRNGYIPVVYVNKVDAECLDELRDMEVIILGDNKNVGLGRAFKDFEVWADRNGARKFVYFDQDTKVSESSWKTIDSVSNEAFIDRHVGLVFFSSSKLQLSPLVISSGCVFLLDRLKKIGFHDETFFVEGVDYDLCLKLHCSGYRIQRVYDLGIDHDSLQDNSFGSILGKKIAYRCYGRRRLADFNRSHFKLIYRSLKFREFCFFYYFLRSLFSFNVKEIYSNFLRLVSS